MAVIKPFAALRPKPDLASQICELPYDVMSSEEARQLAAGNPLSFLHVSKPEIDLPQGADPHSPEVYARGQENFRRLITTGALRQDPAPAFYLYRQIMGGHQQLGLVATASCEEYRSGVIKKHELTRPDKEDDRVRHIEALESQTGPVFLTYRAPPALDALVTGLSAQTPDIDFKAADGVLHTSWVLTDVEVIRAIESIFESVPCLYIADGHHRSAAAARVASSRRGKGGSGRFLAVIFPHNQMRILPYNRALKDLNGRSAEDTLRTLSTLFEIEPAREGTPPCKHSMRLYLDHRWHALKFRESLTSTPQPVDRLDAALLQRHVLAPVFGIEDPRTSERIQFVGGIRGPLELERRVESKEFACAFSMFPTGIEDLMCIADAGDIMPPKSTWFEPKLRDGMFCHMIAALPAPSAAIDPT